MVTAQQRPTKIILGIDPGTNVMGYGVIRTQGNKAEMVVMGVIDMRKEKDVLSAFGQDIRTCYWYHRRVFAR